MQYVYNASGDLVYTISQDAISSDASANAVIDYSTQLNTLINYGECALIGILLLFGAYMIFKELRGWR